MNRAIIFDTETTGLTDPEVIEAAWMPVEIVGGKVEMAGSTTCRRYRPLRPISLGAMAVHHIMDEDLVDEPPSSTFALPEGVQYLIGYNVDFDWRAIGFPDVKRIDVLAFARQLWPEADSHTLSAMIYRLYRHEGARRILEDAHQATADVYLCSLVLWHVVDQLGPFLSFDALWHASEHARVSTHMPFGKHRGVPIYQVPADYRAWLLRQPDTDPYLATALRNAAAEARREVA